MRLADWGLMTTRHKATLHENVLCVALPFMDIPGVMERLFSNAHLEYVSLVPRPGVVSPALLPKMNVLYPVPLLSLHLELVRAYWSTSNAWGPWRFLEDDFDVLRKQGFEFDRGEFGAYCRGVRCAASQFVDCVAEMGIRAGASAIAVYGRGHWTMNAAALAAQRMNVPLYVIERGILPNSYVADADVPFTAPGSNYRAAWARFHDVDDWEFRDPLRLEESRWQLYASMLTGKPRQSFSPDQSEIVVVGQCLFDYNCLNAPFDSPVAFVEYVARLHPNLVGRNDVRYRPHPLSPEEYPDGTLETSFGRIPVDRPLQPWNGFQTNTQIYTWNSTLGLEAALLFDAKVTILDPECHYWWVHGRTSRETERYVAFLNHISIPRDGAHV